MSTKIFGVKIILKDAGSPITADETIGLYNVENSNSEFRWAQVAGYTGWKEGIIAEKGFGEFSKVIDIAQGGNTATGGTASITVINGNLMWNILQTKGIYLNDCITEIYLLEPPSTATLYWRGRCKKPTWDSKTFKISMAGYYEFRKANLSKLINPTEFPNATSELFNKSIPVVFGDSFPHFNSDGDMDQKSLAAFQRIANMVDENHFNNTYLSNCESNVYACTYVGLEGQYNPSYSFKTEGTLNFASAIYPKDLYISIIDGLGENQIRKVLIIYPDDIDPEHTFTVILSGFFTTELATNDLNNDRSYCKLLKLYKQYQSDTWPCKSFLDSYGASITNSSPEMYVVDGDTFSRVANYGSITIDQTVNKLSVDAQLYDSDINKLTSAIILPVENLGVPSTVDYPDLSVWEHGDESWWSTFQSNWGGYQPGIYCDDSQLPILTQYSAVSMSFASDFNDETYAEFTFKMHQGEVNARYIKVLHFDLPEPPNNFTFDKVYLGISMYTWALYAAQFPEQTGESTCRVMFRKKNFGAKDDGIFNGKLIDETDGGTSFIDTLPDSYFVTNNTHKNNNKHFYKGSRYLEPDSRMSYGGTPPNNQWYVTSGYKRFELTSMNSLDKYNAIYQGGLFFMRNGGAGVDWPDETKIYALAIIFEKSDSDISEKFYSPFAGRIYNDSWSEGPSDGLPLGVQEYASFPTITFGFSIVKPPATGEWTGHDNEIAIWNTPGSAWTFYTGITHWAAHVLLTGETRQWDGSAWSIIRKQDEDLIQNPKDILEHVCRLQNYSDTSITPTLGWGKSYADSPLINTDSFDSEDVASLDAYQISRCILEESDCMTDALKKSLCRNFWLMNWVDKNGAENIQSLSKSLVSSDLITLSDITDKSRINIVEPDSSEIYIEPYVQYNRNVINGNFESAIRIHNAGAGAYTSAFVEGMNNEIDARLFWSYCHSLALRSRQITQPPTDMTDLVWANGLYAYTIAHDHLWNWINWQYNKEIEFPVHFDTAGDWEEGHCFSIQLPHHTNNVQKKCFTEQITINPNPPYDVKIKAIMLD